jgi:Fe-S cluster assembly scaffold protein SufB
VFESNTGTDGKELKGQREVQCEALLATVISRTDQYPNCKQRPSIPRISEVAHVSGISQDQVLCASCVRCD